MACALCGHLKVGLNILTIAIPSELTSIEDDFHLFWKCFDILKVNKDIFGLIPSAEFDFGALSLNDRAAIQYSVSGSSNSLQACSDCHPASRLSQLYASLCSRQLPVPG